MTSRGAFEVAVGEHVVDERVRNQTVIDHDGIVRVVPAERGPAVDDERAYGCAVAVGR